MSGDPKITVVIPTHNRREILEKTLSRLLAMPAVEVRILVFADACSDGTEEMVRSRFPSVRLIASSEKMGHSMARSCAFTACDTEFILSLDDDSWPMDEDYAGRILEAFGNHPRAAFIATNVYDREYPGGAAQSDTTAYAVRNFVGCGFAVRAAIFHELGGFRSCFQYGGEELEIALRAHARGWEIIFVPGLRVYHDKTPQNRDEHAMIRSGVCNNLSACFLNEPAWICLPHMVRLGLKATVHAARRGHFSAAFLAWRDFFGRLPRLARERRPLPPAAIFSWHRLRSCPPL
jgi:GT2 family glycosyltransferase